MTPIELVARRKRLGLSQEELGRCLALVSPMPDGSDRPPVKQSTIARWEGKRGIPQNVEITLKDSLDSIEKVSDFMCDRIKGIAEHSSAVHNSPTVNVRVYKHDSDFWEVWPDLKGWPHILWNIAATVALDDLKEEYGIIGDLVCQDGSRQTNLRTS